MPYSTDQLKELARRAYNAGDYETAQRAIDELDRQQSTLGGQFAEGLKRAAEGIAQGAQYVGLSGALGYRPGEITERIESRRARSTPPQTTAQSIARGVGEYGPGVAAGFAFPPLRASMPLRMAANALIGGGLAGTQYTPPGESKAAQTLIGAGLGGAVPEVLGLAGTGIRRALQVVPEEVAQANLQAYQRLGITPSMGQVSQSPALQGLETRMVGAAGGRSASARFIEQTQQQLGRKQASIARALGRGKELTRTGAGETIIGGIDDYMVRFRARSEELYDELYDTIGRETPISLINTLKEAARIVTPKAGAEASTKALTPPMLRRQIQAIITDVSETGGRMPFESFRAVRSLIGDQIDAALKSNLPKSGYKRLYRAMTQDIKDAASAHNAGAIAQHADDFYRTESKFIEDFLEKVNRKVSGEDVFKHVMSGSKEGATRLKAIRRSLTKEQWDHVAGVQLEKMGEQIIDGVPQFSSGRFLGNWARLDDEAKRVLFANKQYIQDLDDIAKVSGLISEQARRLANPSGTSQNLFSQVFNLQNAGIGFLIDPTLGLSLGAVILANSVTPHILRRPAMVRWVAQGTRLKTPSAVRQWLGRLSALSYPAVSAER